MFVSNYFNQQTDRIILLLRKMFQMITKMTLNTVLAQHVTSVNPGKQINGKLKRTQLLLPLMRT